ncbi:MAG: UDP-N-acetylmuramate--L-alanine ligase [Candidatus Muiribacteriota bacterium]
MNINLKPTKNIHFIGVGGTGMSGLAKIIHSFGYNVSGSDLQKNKVTVELENFGINIFYTHNSANIKGDTQLIVKSAAVSDNNPEVFTAKARNISVIKYAEMLGYIMDLKKGIAVAGTHGKTTISSMLAYIMNFDNIFPGYVIGGVVPQLNGSSSPGKNDYFIAEACEYDKSFLNLNPLYGIVNNIEEDHLDYYKNIKEIKIAFKKFINKINPEGCLFYSASSQNIKEILKKSKVKKISYGYDIKADFSGSDYYIDKEGMTSYFIKTPDNKRFEIKISLFGMHNVINSLAAFAICHTIGINGEQIVEALKRFKGIKRRFEIIYKSNECIVVDDYAHHPTEIKTVLKYARKKYLNKRIICVFQPHQHSRTRFLLEDFASSFSDSDIIVVPDIFFVRDSEIEKKMISSKELVKKIVSNKGNAFYIPSFLEIEKFLLDNIIENDIIIFMGAGNINEIAYSIKDKFSRK